mgnify:CR=1 FL=1
MARPSPDQDFLPGMKPEEKISTDDVSAEEETGGAETIESLRRFIGRRITATENIPIEEKLWYAPRGIPPETEGSVTGVVELPDGSMGLSVEFDINSDSGDFHGSKSEHLVGRVSCIIRSKDISKHFRVEDASGAKKIKAPEAKRPEKRNVTSQPTGRTPLSDELKSTSHPPRIAEQPETPEIRPLPTLAPEIADGDRERFAELSGNFSAYVRTLAEDHSVTGEEIQGLKRRANDIKEAVAAMAKGRIEKHLRDEGGGKFLTTENIVFANPISQELEGQLLGLMNVVRQAIKREGELDRKKKLAPRNRGPAWVGLPEINNILLEIYTASQQAADALRRRSAGR